MRNVHKDTDKLRAQVARVDPKDNITMSLVLVSDVFGFTAVQAYAIAKLIEDATQRAYDNAGR
jgi:hypothetical protein